MSIVPNEIPTKCDFFILRKSKTSRISLAKAEKVYCVGMPSLSWFWILHAHVNPTIEHYTLFENHEFA